MRPTPPYRNVTRHAPLLDAIAIALLLCAAPVLGRCAPAKPAPPKEVRIGYFANVTHAQAVLGVSSGDFEKALAPSKLTTRVFNAGPALIESLFAGEIDIGYVGPSPALNAYIQSRGKGLRVIAGGAANGVLIVARAGSGIEKLEDLKDRRLATPQLGNTQDISARHYLTAVLGQKNTDNVVPVPNAEQAMMMSRGEIDAAWAVEPWGSRLVAEAGAKIIGEEKDLWPDHRFILTLVVASPDFLKEHPDAVEAILRVHHDWTERLSADPAAQAEPLTAALSKLTNQKLSKGVVESSLKHVSFTDDPLADSIRTFARWASELGVARSVPNVAALIDTRALDKLRGEMPPKEPGAPTIPAPAPAGEPKR